MSIGNKLELRNPGLRIFPTVLRHVGTAELTNHLDKIDLTDQIEKMM